MDATTRRIIREVALKINGQKRSLATGYLLAPIESKANHPKNRQKWCHAWVAVDAAWRQSPAERQFHYKPFRIKAL